ncbi:shikimate 5-dehydrogenase [Natranaerobius thermophilus]|uniref:Shikimate/quinate 5-dehydrogenase n=1 Tax=Natranaerobius thermophilus (strain ATCC BAA-1301 / DSM 18059 / JW/NM-WN-LF) TaxID=457570 RepID=B2A3T8_NATTJ|nr:shikimate 5-dehydrogenase [Natranaerobius thermophilus]ACB83714.1 Shikimate/quinate 5-dehydrogenase [Natranaerobius thermophilus JW/NM-WN-LF]
MDKFAFIIHPIYHSDIIKKFPFLKALPENILEKTFGRLPPFKVSNIEGVESPHNQIEGCFVACPLSSNQILNLPQDYVIKKIIKAGKKAEELGAQVVGLGALTSVVGDAGVTVAKNLNIPVTTGNSYTVATAIEGVKSACQMMDFDHSEAHVAVLGASGSIGKVIAKKFARESRWLTLLGRDKDKLETVSKEIYNESGMAAKVTNQIKKNISEADIVFAVTGAADAVISGEELKPGAIVCDVARPRDVSWRVAQSRDDVLVIEGGIVEIPGDVEFNFNFGFPPKTAYACMAETMILALEKKYESFSLGRDLSLDKVEQISRLAEKHNFRLAGFRSFEKAVSKETVDQIKQNAMRKRIKFSTSKV